MGMEVGSGQLPPLWSPQFDEAGQIVGLGGMEQKADLAATQVTKTCTTPEERQAALNNLIAAAQKEVDEAEAAAAAAGAQSEADAQRVAELKAIIASAPQLYAQAQLTIADDQAQLTASNTRIAELQAALPSLQAASDNANAEAAAATQAYNDAQQALATAQAEYDATMTALNAQYEQETIEVSEHQQAIADINARIQQLQASIPLLAQTMTTMRAQATAAYNALLAAETEYGTQQLAYTQSVTEFNTAYAQQKSLVLALRDQVTATGEEIHTAELDVNSLKTASLNAGKQLDIANLELTSAQTSVQTAQAAYDLQLSLNIDPAILQSYQDDIAPIDARIAAGSAALPGAAADVDTAASRVVTMEGAVLTASQILAQRKSEFDASEVLAATKTDLLNQASALKAQRATELANAVKAGEDLKAQTIRDTTRITTLDAGIEMIAAGGATLNAIIEDPTVNALELDQAPTVPPESFDETSVQTLTDQLNAILAQAHALANFTISHRAQLTREQRFAAAQTIQNLLEQAKDLQRQIQALADQNLSLFDQQQQVTIAAGASYNEAVIGENNAQGDAQIAAGACTAAGATLQLAADDYSVKQAAVLTSRDDLTAAQIRYRTITTAISTDQAERTQRAAAAGASLPPERIPPAQAAALNALTAAQDALAAKQAAVQQASDTVASAAADLKAAQDNLVALHTLAASLSTQLADAKQVLIDLNADIAEANADLQAAQEELSLSQITASEAAASAAAATTAYQTAKTDWTNQQILLQQEQAAMVADQTEAQAVLTAEQQAAQTLEPYQATFNAAETVAQEATDAATMASSQLQTANAELSAAQDTSAQLTAKLALDQLAAQKILDDAAAAQTALPTAITKAFLAEKYAAKLRRIAQAKAQFLTALKKAATSLMDFYAKGGRGLPSARRFTIGPSQLV